MLNNGPLQTGVAYMSPSFLGAYNGNVPHNIDSYAFGTELTAGTIVPYGSFMVGGTDGAKLPEVGITAASILGVLAYGVNGVTQEAGLEAGGLYKLLPLLNFGRIWVRITNGATLAIGDAVSLNLAATDQFNTVRKLPSLPVGTDIDISSIARVSQPSNADGMVELTIKQYLN